jgi:hypothetical protein
MKVNKIQTGRTKGKNLNKRIKLLRNVKNWGLVVEWQTIQYEVIGNKYESNL